MGKELGGVRVGNLGMELAEMTTGERAEKLGRQRGKKEAQRRQRVE